MKSKITRILGVVLTLSMLVSLALTAAPVSAGTQAWDTFPTPLQGATGKLVLDNGNTYTGPFAIAKDGTAIYAASNVGGSGAALVKSADGGRTWTKLTGFTYAIAGAGTFTDIVCSSIDAKTVYVTDGATIWKSIDAGTTWAPLSSLFTSLGLTSGLAGSGFITSLDVGYLGTSPYIFAGLSAFGFGAVGGGAFVCEEAVWGMPWTNLLIGTDRPVAFAGLADVTKIVVDPANFATTQMIMAVVTDRTANVTLISTKYGGAQWDSVVNDVSLPGVANDLYTTSLWLPSDFSSTLASGKMQAFAGVDSMAATEGDVFLAVFAVPAALPTAAFDLNVNGIAVATHVSGLDGVGAAATASLLASGSTQTALTTPRVFRSTTGGFTWMPDTKSPTGGATPFGIGRALPSILVLDSTTALVGTQGPDCGVSITKDYGATWNTISLINDAISNIDDLEISSFFMTTWSAVNESVWRLDGANWERVFSTSIYPGPVGPFYLVEKSPAGDAVFVAIVGSTQIWRSTDNGQTWMLQVNNITSTGLGTGTIGALAVINKDSVVVGDGTNANAVYTTTTNGGFWFTRTCSVGVVQSLARDKSTGDLLAGGISAGVAKVALSQNAGVSWSAIAAAVSLGVDTVDTAGDAATNVIVAFSDKYATSKTIFATGTITADASGNDEAGVWKYDYSATTPAWSRIDSAGVVASVTNGTGLVAAPAVTSVSGAGMVYAADAALGQGVSRVRQPRTVSEQMADATSTFGSLGSGANNLWYKAGSNVLYSIDMTGWRIRSYTDTLNVSGTGVAVSAITTTTASVTWTALANATNYLIVVNPVAQTNFYTAANGAGITVTYTAGATTAAISTLASGVTYNVSVWAATPVSSYLFDAAAKSFTTLPAPPIAPANLVPVNGAVNVPVMGPAFAWSAPTGVPGITGYKFQLTKDPTFATHEDKTPAVPYLVWDKALDYETAYYWRVCAVTAAGDSAWVTSVFTTVAKPAPPITVSIPPQITPTVIMPPATVIVTVIPPVVTTQPQQTVVVTVVPPVVTQTTITSVVQIPETKAPVYIWAIVAIGAVLTLAVIVLIVRTRRVV